MENYSKFAHLLQHDRRTQHSRNISLCRHVKFPTTPHFNPHRIHQRTERCFGVPGTLALLLSQPLNATSYSLTGQCSDGFHPQCTHFDAAFRLKRVSLDLALANYVSPSMHHLVQLLNYPKALYAIRVM